MHEAAELIAIAISQLTRATVAAALLQDARHRQTNTPIHAESSLAKIDADNARTELIRVGRAAAS
jgi:hypothetical protein